MLKIVTDEEEIRKCQKILEETLKKQLSSNGQFTLGFPGGNMENREVHYNDDVYYSSFEISESTPRFWNGFGLSSELQSTRKSKNISVEINIPTKGVNKNIAGVFAKDEQNNLMLIHRGKVGGGRKGINKKAFLSWYPESFKSIYDDENNKEQAVLVGTITSDNFVNELTNFINNVALFKKIAVSGEINEATYISDKDLQSHLESKNPKKITVTSTCYERSVYISEFAKRCAKGKCQLCLCDAPFKNKLGKPHLETHHIIWLSRGGDDSIENTVALCPNCHSKMHILDLEQDRNILKKRVENNLANHFK